MKKLAIRYDGPADEGLDKLLTEMLVLFGYEKFSGGYSPGSGLRDLVFNKIVVLDESKVVDLCTIHERDGIICKNCKPQLARPEGCGDCGG
jgi:hypothetical protein